MKINLEKIRNGYYPADDIAEEKTQKLPQGEYEVDIKVGRNPAFHGKVMAFIRFCYEHWGGDREHLNDSAQFDYFRRQLTVLSGYYNEVWDLSGSLKLEAQSLSYSSMSQSEFEDFYHAAINAALKHIFKGCDSNTEYRLLSFF